MERSTQRITETDLLHLGQIALVDRERMFENNPHWRPYRNRVLCVALCQGAALHYLDHHNGIKDFDVWTFFARSPLRPHPDPALYRRNKPADFGPSRFGHTPGRPSWITGRRVDLLARSLDVVPSANATESIRAWLENGRSTTARKLRAKAVIMIAPTPGTVIWPPG